MYDATKICRDKSFVAITSSSFFFFLFFFFFLATSILFLQQKTCFVATTSSFILFFIFCRDKRFVATSILLSRQKTCFVATNTSTKVLSRQKLYLWQLPPIIFHHVFVSVCVSNICQTRKKENVPSGGTSFASLFDFVAYRFSHAGSKLNTRGWCSLFPSVKTP